MNIRLGPTHEEIDARASAADIANDEAAHQRMQLPALSSHIAHALITRSPLHAWFMHPKLNPDYREEEKAAFDLGTAAHAVFLEGAESRLGIVEADDWRTKAAKETRDSLRASGKIPMLARQAAQVKNMVRVAREYVAGSEIAGIFERGKPEVELRWEDGKIPCRGRLDFLADDSATIIDYKTTGNAEPNYFGERLAPAMGYDLQAAFYLRGVQRTRLRNARFIWLVQEVDPPYACSLVAMTPQMEDYAERKREYAVTLWAKCLHEDRWNGYPKQIAYVELPAYAAARVDELMELATT